MQAEKSVKTTKERMTGILFTVYRFVIVLTLVSLFIPGFNPAKICGLISENMSLFTSGVSYSALTANTIRAFTRDWAEEGTFILLYISSLFACLGCVGAGASICMSLGNLKMKRQGNIFAIIGSCVSLFGFLGIVIAYLQISQTTKPEKVEPNFPYGFFIILGLYLVVLVISVILLALQPKPAKDEVGELPQKYKLFLLISPFVVLTFLFSYLTLWGWRYAFFDYQPGTELSIDNFVGLKWFKYLFFNSATNRDMIRVLVNTFAMSGLGLIFTWVPMAFAIFLCEVKNLRVRRFIQTFTTIPNFISWVLVYSVANVIFASDGLISNFIVANGGQSVNFLMSSQNIWIKMFAWGMWKGVGWSAIIYIAGISGIDQQLYEAATVDGAGRFQRIWNVTVPGLIPTFMVLLLMGVAGILSNGLDQYLVFRNANNAEHIEVLDLYVYIIGIGKGKIPLSTVVGMLKSIISIALLFGANKISKIVRGSTII